MGVLWRFCLWLWSVLAAAFDLLGRILGWVWRPLVQLWQVVRPTRFSALLIAVGGVLLAFTGQGAELAIGLGEGEGLDKAARWAFFLAAVLLLAVQSWYWARFSLYHDSQFGDDRGAWDRPRPGRDPEMEPPAWLIKLIPRAYAFLIFGLAAFALVRAGPERLWAPLVLIVLGALLFAGLVYRANLFAPEGKAWLWRPTRFGAPWLGVLLFGFGFIVALAIFIAAWIDATWVGNLLGAVAVAFFSFGAIIAFGSLLVYRSLRLGFPAITSVVALAVLFSPLNDNHHVRRVTDGGGVDKRVTVDVALGRWGDANPGRGPGGGEDVRTIVFVSTAGGGLRAAYWTAIVLGRLQDENPDFARRLFSISGVSGGSLGAVVFVALLNERDKLPAGGYAAAARNVLGRDFLAPALAGMLYTDLMQRFLPAPFLPDRAAALEKAWEHGWKDACRQGATEICSDPERLAKPFLALWDKPETGAAWRPALLLNGAHQESGKRIVTSNLRITRSVFADAFDFHALAGYEVRASTAALNSARFPIVSPAGTMVRQDVRRGHILDGGYFENFGAETTAGLAFYLLNPPDKRKPRLRPVFIEISSDPDLSGADIVRDGVAPPPATDFLTFGDSKSQRAKIHRFGNELLAPVDGLLSARQARGILAAKRLARRAEKLPDGAGTPSVTVARFRLCHADGDSEPALGWVLSRRTRRGIDRLLDGGQAGTPEVGSSEKCAKENQQELDKVLAALR